jgi:hypothetical protein
LPGPLRGVPCKGFGPDGKRRRYKVSGRIKQDVIEALNKNKDIDAELSTSRPDTVEAAAHDWLEYGLPIGTHPEGSQGCVAPLRAKISKRRWGTSPPRGL